MHTGLRILLLILAAAFGVAAMYAVIMMAVHLNLTTQITDDAQIRRFQLTYFGGGAWACIFSSLVGLGTFFTEGRRSTIFLLLPAVLPVIYYIGALVYFLA